MLGPKGVPLQEVWLYAEISQEIWSYPDNTANFISPDGGRINRFHCTLGSVVGLVHTYTKLCFCHYYIAIQLFYTNNYPIVSQIGLPSYRERQNTFLCFRKGGNTSGNLGEWEELFSALQIFGVLP